MPDGLPLRDVIGLKIADKATLHQLSRILASKTFSQVERLKRFISFIVTETVAGRSGELKEYVIGVQVFAKDPSFDPRTDPIVRVQARRLRARLVKYYREEGQGDEIAIDLPKGGYSPVFRRKESTASGKPSLSATLAGRNTVFVRPFADRSPQLTLDYFCRGVRDEIVHTLTSIKALRVLAATGDEADQDRTDAALLIDGACDWRAITRASPPSWLTGRAAITCGQNRLIWRSAVPWPHRKPWPGSLRNVCSRRSSRRNPRLAIADPATISPRGTSICRAAIT